MYVEWAEAHVTSSMVTAVCHTVNYLLVTSGTSVTVCTFTSEPTNLILSTEFKTQTVLPLFPCYMASGSIGTRCGCTVVLVYLTLVSIPPNLTVAGIASNKTLEMS